MKLSQNGNRKIGYDGLNLDDPEAIGMHRLIAVKNIAARPKTPMPASIIEPSARSGFRSLPHVVSEN
jgi:hypothetical protein